MMRRAKWILLVSFLSLAGCAGKHELNYRMTVEVEIPQGLRSGSSVWQYTYTDKPDLFIVWRQGAWGEAVAVDLPGNRTLFMVVEQYGLVDYAMQIPRAVFSDELAALNAGSDVEIDLTDKLDRLKETSLSKDLTIPQMPAFAMFRDLRDLVSVEYVRPEEFSTKLGSGYKLHRVNMTITKDPVGEGIVARLPWLTEYYGQSLDRASIHDNSRASNTLGAGSFRRIPNDG